MLDCGIRVTETVRLQLKHFNFMENYVIIEYKEELEGGKSCDIHFGRKTRNFEECCTYVVP